MEKIISLIHTGDKNAWVLPDWYRHYSKYWTGDIKTALLTEEITPKFDNVETLATGKDDWSSELIKGLNLLTSRYVIYQHEDFFLTGEVDFKKIYELLDIMQTLDIDLLKCCGKDVGWCGAQLKPMKIMKDLFDYSLTNEYIISHQVSIWRKEYLIRSLREGESPWQHEIDGTKRARKEKPKVVAYKSEFGVPNTYPIPYIETVRAGRIRPGKEKYFEENK